MGRFRNGLARLGPGRHGGARMRVWLAVGLGCSAGAMAAEPARVRVISPAPRAPVDYRIAVTPDEGDPALKVDDPRSMLRTGYGGALIDVFPWATGKFHLSAGGRLYRGNARVAAGAPESLRALPQFRAGPRLSRRVSPTLLVGYGHAVEHGLALGVDAGVVMGKVVQTPDRVGRLNRARIDAGLNGGQANRANGLARVTALYRF